MDYFRIDLSKNRKRRLYRVQYPGSLTKYTPESGLEARDTISFFKEADVHYSFTNAITRHLSWSHMLASPFISLFGDKAHAEKWALKRSFQHGRECTVLTIDMKKLKLQDNRDAAYVMKAEDVVGDLSLEVPKAAQASLRNEYLVLHRVPAEAIVESRVVDNMRREFCPSPV